MGTSSAPMNGSGIMHLVLMLIGAAAVGAIGFALLFLNQNQLQNISPYGVVAGSFPKVPWGEELALLYMRQGERSCSPSGSACRYRSSLQVGTSELLDGRRNPTWSVSELIVNENERPQLSVESVMRQGDGPNAGTMYST